MKEIFAASLTGLTGAAEKLNESSISSEHKVKIVISISEAGLVNVDEAVAEYTVETKGKGLVDSVLSFFGSGDQEKEKKEKESNKVGYFSPITFPHFHRIRKNLTRKR